jgi:hypothetical protein
MAIKKGRTKNFSLSCSLFLLVPGCEILDGRQSVSGIQDKHPGSATLLLTMDLLLLKDSPQIFLVLLTKYRYLSYGSDLSLSLGEELEITRFHIFQKLPDSLDVMSHGPYRMSTVGLRTST